MRRINHPYRWLAVGAAVVFVVLAFVIAEIAHATLLNNAWIVNALAAHYGADANVATFHAWLFPRLEGQGAGLRLGPPGDVPLATVRSFRFATTWHGLWQKPPQVREVQLTGLVMNVRTGQRKVPPPGTMPVPRRARMMHRPPEFVLDSVLADGAVLRLIPANPHKPPRVFPFDRLRLKRAGAAAALGYDAVFFNPVPRGMVHAQGDFGPWNIVDGADTPVSGRFVFGPADLATIRGIAGKLQAGGSFRGTLGAITANGDASIPNFSLGGRGHPMPLFAAFQTLIDGTSGDTAIQSVSAHLPHSFVRATGLVERHPRGEKITMHFVADPARVEDFLMLTVSAPQPLLTGALRLNGTLVLPPGTAPVDQRLNLNATFAVANAAFTSSDFETSLNRLSRIGQGANAQVDTRTVFDLHGTLAMDQSLAHFSDLEFSIPGATIALAGDYDLQRETLNFNGHLQLQASLSQMTTGLKSLLLRPFNRLVAGPNGGIRLPLRISGPRDRPKFSVDWRHAIHF